MSEAGAGETVLISEIVGVKEAAEMLHVKETTVGAWSTRRILADGNGTGFPDPIKKLSGRYLMWDARKVRAWYRNYQPAPGHVKVGYLDEHLYDDEGQQ